MLQPRQADAEADTHTQFPSEMLGTAVLEKAEDATSPDAAGLTLSMGSTKTSLTTSSRRLSLPFRVHPATH